MLDIGAGDTHGEGGVDLALDKQNRPRVAYRIPAPTDELAYVACNSGCESSPQDWRRGIIPATASAEQELGLPPRQGCPDCIPPIPPCPSAFCDSGYWPSIALYPAGRPRIAFEVQLQLGSRCRLSFLSAAFCAGWR